MVSHAYVGVRRLNFHAVLAAESRGRNAPVSGLRSKLRTGERSFGAGDTDTMSTSVAKAWLPSVWSVPTLQMRLSAPVLRTDKYRAQSPGSKVPFGWEADEPGLDCRRTS